MYEGHRCDNLKKGGGKISQPLTQSGIPVCVLKGPLLAQRLFGDIGLRSSTDLDLLAPHERLLDADALLQEQGCQRISPA
ncbi:MAG: nucleotidyltransferase family protein, partial [Nitrospirae bacterium]|nr:nucleotidyltransferase family protein [Nitrospirota bacterium]